MYLRHGTQRIIYTVLIYLLKYDNNTTRFHGNACKRNNIFENKYSSCLCMLRSLYTFVYSCFCLMENNNNKKRKTENKHPHHKPNINITNISSQHVLEICFFRSHRFFSLYKRHWPFCICWAICVEIIFDIRWADQPKSDGHHLLILITANL